LQYISNYFHPNYHFGVRLIIYNYPSRKQTPQFQETEAL
jgi:hypothetical protein